MVADTELRGLRARVSLLEGSRLLLYREVPSVSHFTIDTMFDRLEELVADRPSFSYVLDLTETQRPSAEVRAYLRRRIARLRPTVAGVAVVVGGNLVLRAMVRIMGHGLGLPPMTVHATREEALARLRRDGLDV